MSPELDTKEHIRVSSLTISEIQARASQLERNELALKANLDTM